MSLSAADRAAHLKTCLATALTEVGDQYCYERVSFAADDEEMADHPRSTWADLVAQGFMEPSPHRHEAYRFTAWGWYEALRLSGYLGTPEFQERIGNLCAALKSKVDGREEDGWAEVEEIATAAKLPVGWVQSALAGALLPGFYLDHHYSVEIDPTREIVTKIPVNFGLRKIWL